jgi:uncharacterized membrane protein YbhN (UPF0104 family)
MYNNLLKYKRIVFILIKLVIISCALYFIHQKLANNQLLAFKDLHHQLSLLVSKNGWLLLLLLLLTDVNWLLEIYKWKLLASIEHKISFYQSYIQSFASLAASIITPNRVGEYAVKAIYFKRKSRKKIIALNFIGNISQLITTIIFGGIGICYLILNFKIHLPTINKNNLYIIIILSSVLFYISKKIGVLNFISFQFYKVITYFKEISFKFYSKILLIAFARYLVFSHQFYLLCRLFDVENNYFTIINLIFCSYFIASILPSFAIFDWVLKGSVALFMFSFIELNELTIITITTIMWLLNIAIPALFGSIFVLSFNFPEDE